MAAKKQVQVKKVKPYPIDVGLQGGAQPIQGKIVRLVGRGFQAVFEKQLLFVGQEFSATFEIPVSKHVVQGPVRVIAVHDQLKPGTRHFIHIVEFHFNQAIEKHTKAIKAFVRAIGQDDI